MATPVPWTYMSAYLMLLINVLKLFFHEVRKCLKVNFEKLISGLPHPTVIISLFNFRPDGHQETCNWVSSQRTTKCISEKGTENLPILTVISYSTCCSPQIIDI